MRAEFRVWHEGDDLYYIMFDSATRQRYRVDQFPAASRLINQLMPAILAGVREAPLLRHKLFQVDFLTTLSGEALVSLLYHKRLAADWEVEARALRAQLRDAGFCVDVIGRAHKQKLALERDFVLERLPVQERTLDRITSYNVCYTKLLRVGLEPFACPGIADIHHAFLFCIILTGVSRDQTCPCIYGGLSYNFV